LVDRVRKHQEEDHVTGIVFAFDMSPLYQKLNKEPDMLLKSKEKAQLLDGIVDCFVDCPFDETISSMSAEDFIKDVLVNRFHAKYIVVGTDFHFGHNKHGDYHMLQALSQKYGYQVEVIDKICYEGREISSTYIKEELKKGNTELVNHLLGYVKKF
jgi:riboflavin kinase/FMN adenylyltransferase